MKLTEEQYYLINMILSCLYVETPRPKLTINRLKVIRDSNHYNEDERKFLNVLRERCKEQLRVKYDNAKVELEFKRRASSSFQ